MRTLYHCPRSRSFRVLWTLEELQLPYRLELLPFPPRVHARAFLAENPLGTVPLYVEGDLRMTESVAICQYLASRHGAGGLGVTGSEPDQGTCLDLAIYAEASLMFPLAIHFRYTRVEPPERRLAQAAEDYRRFFGGRLRKLDALLQDGREFACAGRFTVADISLGASLMFARNSGLGELLGPRVSDYLDRLTARDGFRRAVAAENPSAGTPSDPMA